MATNRTVTVKTSGGDYNSLSAAIAGEKGNLVTADRQLTIECYAMSDTAAVSINNADWTLDATRYIHIRVPAGQRHDGKWSTSAYRLEPASAQPLTVNVKFVYLEGLQIASPGNYGVVQLSVPATGATDYRIWDCILRGHANMSSRYILAINNTTDANNRVRVWNSLFYGASAASGAAWRIDVLGSYDFWNNTVQGNGYGIYRNNGTVVLKNNLFSGNTSNGSGTMAAGTNYNRTSNAALGYTVTGGGNAQDAINQTFTFVDAGAKDFHLAVNDEGARNLGAYNPSSTYYTTDVDGDARGAADWDVGFDEYVSSSIDGTSAATIAPFVSAASGVVSLAGTSVAAIALFLSAAGGVLAFAGSSAAALDPFVSAASGASSILGASAATIAPLASVASGSLQVVGTSAATVGPFISDATGTFSIVGNLAATISPFVSAASGEVVEAGVISGASSAAIGPLVSTALGSLQIVGSSDATIAPFVSTASGIQSIAGASAATIGPFVSVASGTSALVGASAATIEPFISAASGTVALPGSSTATIGPFVSAAAGEVVEANVISGASAATIGPLVSAASGTMAIPGEIEGISAATIGPFLSASRGFIGTIPGEYFRVAREQRYFAVDADARYSSVPRETRYFRP